VVAVPARGALVYVHGCEATVWIQPALTISAGQDNVPHLVLKPVGQADARPLVGLAAIVVGRVVKALCMAAFRGQQLHEGWCQRDEHSTTAQAVCGLLMHLMSLQQPHKLPGMQWYMQWYIC
jgi:hypothetical protein